MSLVAPIDPDTEKEALALWRKEVVGILGDTVERAVEASISGSPLRKQEAIRHADYRVGAEVQQTSRIKGATT